MALAAYQSVHGSNRCGCIADVGAGRGLLAEKLTALAPRVLMLDFHCPAALPPGTEFGSADLNQSWPLADQTVDFAFSLECIEHLENPRHFMREMARVIKAGGHGFLLTPNKHSWASKLTFLLKGQHRYFHQASYPAHITPLLQCDLLWMLQESGLTFQGWFYSNEDVIPKLGWYMHLSGCHFSACLGVLFKKT